MKHQYFNQSKADKDDLLLQDAVSRGWVPPACLLGGWLVHDLRTAQIDPCSQCRGPREKCAGRPFDERAAAAADARIRARETVKLNLAANSEADARRQLRRQMIEKIVAGTRERQD